MNDQDLYDALKEMNNHLNITAAEFSQLQESLVKLLEKNAELEIENQHLRDRVMQISESQETDDQGEHLSKSRRNLEKLYNEGFHICSSYYGKRRMNNEACIFCTDIIYRRR